ncbi:MAG TPA: peptide deformylase [Actinomycetota bacterium]|nr:peptide deformylase [Actinomycetota bacterium]
MAVREVLRYPHPALKTPAARVGAPTPAYLELAGDLVDTMRASPATVGLAAPQVGVGLRAFVLDVSGHPRATSSHGLVVLFDPVLLEAHDPEVRREGCLSVPHLTADVRRARRIVVAGTGPDGRRLVYQMEGFEARAALHELDHLDGLLILDRVSSASDLFPRKTYR